MKYKLKTIFLVTALVALLLASFVRDQYALAEVRRLKEAINTSLSDLDWLNQDDVDFSEFRNDYLLFSSGEVDWSIDLKDQTVPKILLNWKSRLIFAKYPSVTLEFNKTRKQQYFSEEFLEAIAEHEVEVTVIKNGDQLFDR